MTETATLGRYYTRNQLNKVLKPDLIGLVLSLQEVVKITRLDEKSETGEPNALKNRWFGVAYIGWGTWEEDVFFVEAATPVDAIGEFEDAIENGDFEGHGYNLPNDRSLYPSTDERILVYEISEYAEYRKTKWEKV